MLEREDGGTLMPTPSPANPTLVEMLDVLKRISAGLEGAPEPSRSVPYAKDSLQRTILAGTVIIFNGGLLRDPKRLDQCTPWHIAQTSARSASSTGNRAKSRTSSRARPTRPASCAPRPGPRRVSLQWLLDCHARWHRQDETLYALQPQATQQTVAAPARPRSPPPSVDPMTVHVQRAAALTRQSLPEGAGPTEIMSAAIIFLAPAGHQDHARALLARLRRPTTSDVAMTAKSSTSSRRLSASSCSHACSSSSASLRCSIDERCISTVDVLHTYSIQILRTAWSA